MSDRTAASLATLDALLPVLASLDAHPHRAQIVEEAEALRRAVAAFHMEAIRFRIYAVDRLLRVGGDEPKARDLVETLKRELETAGFHTKSHTAP